MKRPWYLRKEWLTWLWVGIIVVLCAIAGLELLARRGIIPSPMVPEDMCCDPAKR